MTSPDNRRFSGAPAGPPQGVPSIRIGTSATAYPTHPTEAESGVAASRENQGSMRRCLSRCCAEVNQATRNLRRLKEVQALLGTADCDNREHLRARDSCQRQGDGGY